MVIGFQEIRITCSPLYISYFTTLPCSISHRSLYIPTLACTRSHCPISSLSHFHSLLSQSVINMEPVLPLIDNDPFVNEVSLRYRTYHCEYVPGFRKQRLPLLFTADFYGHIPKLVRLFDPQGNEFEVCVTKRNMRVYLAEGSQNIGELYGLANGGWLSLVYLDCTSSFLLRVLDRVCDEVAYPIPARRFRLGEKDVPITISDDEENEGNDIHAHDESCYFHSLFKCLNEKDVTTGLLYLPLGFCELALHRSCTHVKIVDESGNQWPCTLHWESDRKMYCTLAGGWSTLCSLKGFKKGTSVKLGVSKDDHHFIYFKLE